MLFHIKHTHSWETCPYHDPDRVKETFGAAIARIEESDLDVLGFWGDAPAHTVFMVVEAGSIQDIEEALAPIIDIGWAETRPVQEMGGITSRRAEAG
jgi:hypothetical protein